MPFFRAMLPGISVRMSVISISERREIEQREEKLRTRNEEHQSDDTVSVADVGAEIAVHARETSVAVRL